MKFKFFVYRWKITIIFLIALIFILLALFSCATIRKTKTTIETKIDTIYKNPVIDTVRVLEKYQIKHDTLYFDTIKIENKFCKAIIYPVHGKIQADFNSKHFEIKIHATKIEKIKEVWKENKKSFKIGLYIGFLIGVFVFYTVSRVLTKLA
jgi:hypothetical protein